MLPSMCVCVQICKVSHTLHRRRNRLSRMAGLRRFIARIILHANLQPSTLFGSRLRAVYQHTKFHFSAVIHLCITDCKVGFWANVLNELTCTTLSGVIQLSIGGDEMAIISSWMIRKRMDGNAMYSFLPSNQRSHMYDVDTLLLAW